MWRAASIRQKVDLVGKGLRLFSPSWRTLEGFETMSMIGKGRVRWVAKGDIVARRFIAKLFAIDA